MRPETLKHYSEALVDDLILSEVSSFDDPTDMAEGLKTVIITCESEDLEWLSYKPTFPDSIFHFTVYDGERSLFATRIFAVLRSFPWNLRIVGAAERLEPYESRKSSPRVNGQFSLTLSAYNLLRQLSHSAQIEPTLNEMSDDDRLKLIAAVCSYVHSSGDVESAGSHPADFAPGGERDFGQHEFWSSSEINALSPNLVRLPDARESAMFLTPPELAYDVAMAAVTLADERLPLRFGDPAIGPGIFYAAVRKASEGLEIESATGVEINSDRAQATAKRWRRTGLHVIAGDFLTQLPPQIPWTILLANPPYVRHQDIDRDLTWLRDALKERVGVRIDGRSDMYMYFVLTAHDWLAAGAVAAWLLPAEFLSTDYGLALRDYLTLNVQIQRLHIYAGNASLFDNARVSSAVVVYSRIDASAEHQVTVTRGGTLQRPEETIRLSTEALRRHMKWGWAALTSATLSSSRRTLGEYFTVKRGIATGANSSFVVGDEARIALDIRTEWIRPLLPKSRLISSSVVEADDDGSPLLESRSWLIDTSESLDSILTKSAVFGNYLKSLERTVGHRTLVRQRHPMYKQEKRDPPTFVFVYMAKADVSGERRFIWNKSRAVALNNYLGLTPKGRLAEAVSKDPTLLEAVHIALRSISSDELQRHGRPYVSGLLKLEPRELANLSLDLEELLG